MDISIIVPTYNAARFIQETIDSITIQTILQCEEGAEEKSSSTKIEVSFYDDNSQDNTVSLVLSNVKNLLSKHISVVFSSFLHPTPIRFDPVAVEEIDDLVNSLQLYLQHAKKTFEDSLTQSVTVDEVKAEAQLPSDDLSQNPQNPKRVCLSRDHELEQASTVVSAAVLSEESKTASSVSSYHPIITVGPPASRKQCVGHSRNQAIVQSSGTWLCMLDSDDIMLPTRLKLQLNKALTMVHEEKTTLVLIGGKFHRLPADATPRYTSFLNSMQNAKDILLSRFRDLPMIQPTWFYSRDLFQLVGGYGQFGKGNPEDLDFFYDALENGCVIGILDEPIIVYRYHETSASWSVSRQTMLTHRAEHLERTLLGSKSMCTPHGGSLRCLEKAPHTTLSSPISNSETTPSKDTQPIDKLHDDVKLLTRNPKFCWDDPSLKFGIWGNGRDGKQFYNRLSDAARARVECFYDISPGKIGQTYMDPRSTKQNRIYIPIKHIDEIRAPFLICVALDRTNGDLESNIDKLNLENGVDYFHVI